MKKIFSVLLFVLVFLTACDKDQLKNHPIKKFKGVECIYVPAGSFIMGGESIYGRNIHNVTLTKGFYIGKYEVTVAQFCDFLNDMKVKEDGKMLTQNDGIRTLFNTEVVSYEWKEYRWEPKAGDEKKAANNISWYGASEFCYWAGGSLPTEAQWEYACRAGAKTIYCYGDDPKKLRDYAWYQDLENMSNIRVHNVGEKLPNKWGLYDMHGNVREWCLDRFTSLGTESQIDPLFTESSNGRIYKGGYFNSTAEECAAAREENDGEHNMIAGLRLLVEDK